MKYEIKKDENKIEIKREDELVNGEITNSSIIQNQSEIILQMNKNRLHS